jgi:hypothetical protein
MIEIRTERYKKKLFFNIILEIITLIKKKSGFIIMINPLLINQKSKFI